MDEMVGQRPQYERFADEFLDHARHGIYNACLDRPACLRLLGDVAGRRVLDAACGPGLYAEELVAQGAEVTGLDHSPALVLNRAQHRTADVHRIERQMAQLRGAHPGWT